MSAGDEPSLREEAIWRWLEEQYPAMIELLMRIVNIDSGSHDKAGVDAVGIELSAFFRAAGMEVETVPQERHGDVLRASIDQPAANDRRPIVLMGHRDTVFPVGETSRRPFRIEGARGYGPGVSDMKAGLVMNAFILAAFARHGGHPAPLVALITGDEEIASPSSRPVIEAEARQARAVFNSEPARLPMSVTTGRKGGIFMELEVFGRAAHSGTNHKDGISAIEELARKIQAIHALTDYDRGLTLNVGVIAGGQTVNTVAARAGCEIDLRYVRAADRADALAAVQAIADLNTLAGISSKLAIKGEFLPYEAGKGGLALFAAYQAAAARAGFHVSSHVTGGCADSGLTSQQGYPTLCSVGPAGGLHHTPDEYVELDTILPCAKALVSAIMRYSD